MINLKTENPGAHIGGILWLLQQTKHRDYSDASILGLMKISMFELGITKEDGKTASANKCYAEDNNPWGMACVSVRPTTQNGCRTSTSGETFGKYASVYDGVCDVFLWLEYNKIPDAVKKSDNASDIISFAESKKWFPDMTGHKNNNSDLAKSFITKGRNALLLRVGLFTALAIIVIGFLLKGSKKASFKKALGPLGALVPKAKTATRRMTRRTMVRAKAAARSTSRRVRAIRARYAMKK